MIHVLICNKPSTRFPGKNELLFDYTYIWLLGELSLIDEECSVYTVGKRLNVDTPRAWTHINTPCNNHHEDIRMAMEAINADDSDVYVLPQLTQPLRRRGLLSEAIDKMREFGLPVISASRSRIDEWRELDMLGRWKKQDASGKRLIYDGALYVWNNKNFKHVFDNSSPHTIVENVDCVVDIDYKEDIPANLNKMWADLMIRK